MIMPLTPVPMPLSWTIGFNHALHEAVDKLQRTADDYDQMRRQLQEQRGQRNPAEAEKIRTLDAQAALLRGQARLLLELQR